MSGAPGLRWRTGLEESCVYGEGGHAECSAGIGEMSKEATLSDAIEHIKNLQNEVLELQRQLADSPGEAWERQGSASCSESFVPTENTHYQGQVELISLGSCKYNLKIFWTKRAGLFTTVLEALCSYEVQVKGEQDVVMVELSNLLSSIVEVPSI
ncbi:hypothetical protein E2562_015913 [Oryza meyeriana var. granulata]|uniref:Uncharacterized protein n=1 Tax=Oryza meyeriana var. granulata TaxID=110450 RepID=A0A6G1CGH7_9ORYZ|nr:hypothetical protein E2562_015913 [Oryza meyeriana var. granulata]